ncbi:hypothetical protein L6452_04455 [Arctium lappa]|uniref:Uncharacterized protein n=1 Tax=Arctium lappa TaxID=4217 RepID=A0ACB9ED18_ARCLA|nr:hypothetical protein L6452_04455 [Arctium lappa]
MTMMAVNDYGHASEAVMIGKPVGHLATVDDRGKKLLPQSLQLYQLLPHAIQDQLMLGRDPHVNVQVGKIEAEKMKPTYSKGALEYSTRQIAKNIGVNGSIVVEKLDEEQLQKLSLPKQVDYFRVPYYFGECGGHLHLVERHNDESRLHLNVYEMMIDHSEWFLKYQVELDELPAAYPEMIHSYLHPLSPNYYEFQVFDVVRGEEEEETFMVVGIPGKMIKD